MKLSLSIWKQPMTRELLLTLVVFLFLIPKPYLTIPELDASWQVALEEAFFQGWEFGTKVNFTGGPLNFLYTPTSMGYFVFGQIIAESLILVLAILLLFRALRDQAIWHSILAFFSLIICAAVGKDGLYLVSIAAGSFILLREKKPGLLLYLIPAFFAILSLMKFSFASLSIACMCALSIGWTIQRSTRLALKLVGSYLGAFLLVWILIGQNPLTIPAFFLNSLQISQGYLWNMNLHEPPGVFFFLCYFLLLTSIPAFLACLASRKNVGAWISLTIAAATIYLSWKAGLTRAGSHMNFFLQASLVVIILIQPIVSKKWLSVSWLSLLTVSYLAAFASYYPGGLSQLCLRTGKAFSDNLVFLANPDSLNQSFTRVIPLVLAERALPEVKEEVGEASIDVLHFQQAILLLNQLNYAPRPTVQNYPAYNSHLTRLNQSHMLNDPPEYILMKYGLVDQRYPYSDDTLYNLEVFQHYRPLLGEKGYMLMKRREEPREIVEERVVLERSIQSGENVDVSQFSNELLWLKVDYRPSLLHRLIAFFYKPEVLNIGVILEDGINKNFRLVGGNLKDGFLLNPLLEGNVALERFLNTHQPQTKIASFTIVSNPGQTWFSTRYFDLQVIALKSKAAP